MAFLASNVILPISAIISIVCNILIILNVTKADGKLKPGALYMFLLAVIDIVFSIILSYVYG